MYPTHYEGMLGIAWLPIMFLHSNLVLDDCTMASFERMCMLGFPHAFTVTVDNSLGDSENV